MNDIVDSKYHVFFCILHKTPIFIQKFNNFKLLLYDINDIWHKWHFFMAFQSKFTTPSVCYYITLKLKLFIEHQHNLLIMANNYFNQNAILVASLTYCLTDLKSSFTRVMNHIKTKLNNLNCLSTFNWRVFSWTIEKLVNNIINLQKKIFLFYLKQIQQVDIHT